MNKTEFYAELNRNFQALMSGETSCLAVLANASALLFERLEQVNWAGFYLLDGNTLVLGPFQGKIACVRIPTVIQKLCYLLRRWRIILLAYWISTVPHMADLKSKMRMGYANSLHVWNGCW